MEEIIAIIILVVSIVAMWYILETIINKKMKTYKKITYFMLGSVVLFASLSYCFMELLKYRL
ncbi:TPA: hypothetical protein PB369_002564 [Staphylococcus aureus]|nr:hypothetical protein [Staphylococcus aureus]